jgi:alpha-tubulin suppressor-like RCC1 family protein
MTSTSQKHAAALTHATGSANVWSWGGGEIGQLGDGSTADQHLPVKVSTSAISGIASIAGGGAHALLIATGGTVWSWGWNGYGQLGVGTTTGPATCVLSNAPTPCSTVPVQVALSNITTVAAGDLHNLAISADGSVWVWGSNQYGQLGTGSITSTGCDCIDAPVRSLLPAGILAVAGGGQHSLALVNDGTVMAFGHNQYGQLGDGSTTIRPSPVTVSNVSGVTAVSAGFFHSLALGSNGKVYAWGRNQHGQLGNGTTTDSSTAVTVLKLTGVTAISAGGEYSMALKSDGTVWTWGFNGNGELGDGTTASKTRPVQVHGLPAIATIMAGKLHALAIDTTGAVWAWGINTNGELGNGTTTRSTVPVRANLSAAVKMLGAGTRYSLAF